MKENTCIICQKNPGKEYVFYSQESQEILNISDNVIPDTPFVEHKGHLCDQCLKMSRWVKFGASVFSMIVGLGLTYLFSGVLELYTLGGGFLLIAFFALIFAIVALIPQKGSAVLANHYNRRTETNKFFPEKALPKKMQVYKKMARINNSGN